MHMHDMGPPPQMPKAPQQQQGQTSGPGSRNPGVHALRGALHTGRSGSYIAMAVAGAVVGAVLVPPLALPILCVPMVVYPAWYVRRERTAYVRQRMAQGISYGGELAVPYRDHMAARRQQAIAATCDKTPFIRYGTATGVLSAQLDGFAPDAGLPFGQTVFDLSQHHLVIGTSGTGKTASLLRPFLWQWVHFRAGGLLVLDGKGSLAAEMRGLPGFTVVEPGIELGLIEGLSPSDVVRSMSSVGAHFGSGGKSEASAFFISEGSTMLFHGATILRALCDAGVADFHWTLYDIYSLLINLNGDPKSHGDKLVGLLSGYCPKSEGEGILIKDALTYACNTIVSMNAETRSNIWATVQSWMSPIFQHPDLVRWSHTEHGIDISSIAEGGLFGVNLPEVKYGKAGVLAQSLIKERVFNVLRARVVDGQAPDLKAMTQIAIVVDEAQELVGNADAAFLPIARSLGGVAVYASQSIDSFYARIGNKDAAAAFLDAFSSQTVFRSSEASIKWISSRLGITMRRRPLSSQRAIGYVDSLQSLALHTIPEGEEGADLERKLRRQGAGQFTLDGSFGRKLGHIDDLHIPAITEFEFKAGPLVEPYEADVLLATKGMALIQVQRGGIRRRDFVRLNKLDDFSEASLKAWEAAYAPPSE